METMLVEEKKNQVAKYGACSEEGLILLLAI